MKQPPYIIAGYVLFMAYLLQYFLLPEWSYLANLQQDQMYRRWSGLALFSVILLQWVLTLVRMTSKQGEGASKILSIHQWLGALSPLFFYIHSMQLGIGYLLILSLIYYFNFLLGLLNIMVIKAMGKAAFRAWFLTHILGSFLIVCIGGFHIWMVFYYE